MPGSAEDFGDLEKKAVVKIQTWAEPDDFVRYGRRALVGWVKSWDLNSERESWFLNFAEARPVVCGGGAAHGGVQMEKSA